MDKTSKSNQAKEGFACSHCDTMVFNCNVVSSFGLCKPCRRLVLVQQLEQMNRSGGSGIDGEIGVLLEKIVEKKKRGFVSKEKELNVYRQADSDNEDSSSELSSRSSSSDGDVDELVPRDEWALYSSEDDGWRITEKRGAVKVKRVGKSKGEVVVGVVGGDRGDSGDDSANDDSGDSLGRLVRSLGGGVGDGSGDERGSVDDSGDSLGRLVRSLGRGLGDGNGDERGSVDDIGEESGVGGEGVVVSRGSGDRGVDKGESEIVNSVNKLIVNKLNVIKEIVIEGDVVEGSVVDGDVDLKQLEQVLYSLHV